MTTISIFGALCRFGTIKALRLASDLNPSKNFYYGLLEELLRANGQDDDADLEVEKAKQMDLYDDDMLDRMLAELKLQ